MTIDPSSTFETPRSTFETPRSTLEPPTESLETPPETLETTRKEVIDSIVARAKAWCEGLSNITSFEQLSLEQQKRATRLHLSDFSWSPGKSRRTERYRTTFGEEFNRFLELATIDWKNETYEDPYDGKTYSSLFFEEEDIEKFMVIRRQRSGLCAAHASVTFQHYLESFRNKTENHTTLDVSHYIRETLSEEKQERYLLTGKFGMNAHNFFFTITGMTEADICIQSPSAGNKTRWNFNWYKKQALTNFSSSRGPALVSNFASGKSFNNSDANKVTYQGRENDFKYKDSGEKQRHAMILIGMHVDDDGMLWFLLQNTWKDKFFVEVSAEYFISCEGILRFVPESVDVSLKDNPAVVNDEYYETSSPISASSNDVLEEGSCGGSGNFFCDDDDDDYDESDADFDDDSFDDSDSDDDY